MALIPWRSKAPTQQLNTLQQEVNRMFEDFFGTWPSGVSSTMPWAPAVSLSEDDKAFTVKAELPGMKPEEIDVNVQDNLLTIRGERKEEKKEQKDKWIRSEFTHGSFSRQVALPSDVDAEGAEARMDKGILTLRLPKSPTRRTRNIEIK